MKVLIEDKGMVALNEKGEGVMNFSEKPSVEKFEEAVKDFNIQLKEKEKESLKFAIQNLNNKDEK